MDVKHLHDLNVLVVSWCCVTKSREGLQWFIRPNLPDVSDLRTCRRTPSRSTFVSPTIDRFK
jgi:hypothetical protein